MGGDGLEVAVQQLFCHPGEEVHGEHDPLGLPSGHWQVPGLAGPAGQNHPVVLLQQLLGGDGAAHVHVTPEFHPRLLHEGNAAVNDLLVQLHIGNAVAQQSAGAIVALEHRDKVASLVKQQRRRQPGRAAAHHGHPLARAHLGGLPAHQAMGKSVLNDLALIVLGGDRLTVFPAGAGRLTQSRTHPGGELGQTVGATEADICLLPVAVVHQIVDLRHQVVEWTAGGHAADHHPRLAEGDAAVHTPGPLLLLLLEGEGGVELVKGLNALQRRDGGAVLPLIFHKSCGLSHLPQPSFPATLA